MNDPSGILLVEDNPNDVELILAALSENQLVDEVLCHARWRGSAGLPLPSGSARVRIGGESRGGAPRPETAHSGRVRSAGADQNRPGPEDDTGGDAHLLARRERPAKELRSHHERLRRKADELQRF